LSPIDYRPHSGRGLASAQEQLAAPPPHALKLDAVPPTGGRLPGSIVHYPGMDPERFDPVAELEGAVAAGAIR
jgi:hypothetical protein